MNRRVISAVIIYGSDLLGTVENPVSKVFAHCHGEGHDMVIFPFERERGYTEVIVFDFRFLAKLRDLESFKQVEEFNHDQKSPYFEFQLNDINEETLFNDLKDEAHCKLKLHYMVLEPGNMDFTIWPTIQTPA
jgi:hypothetical protein